MISMRLSFIILTNLIFNKRAKTKILTIQTENFSTEGMFWVIEKKNLPSKTIFKNKIRRF